MKTTKISKAIGLSVEGRAINAVEIVRRSDYCEITRVRSFLLSENDESLYRTHEVIDIDLIGGESTGELMPLEGKVNNTDENDSDVFDQLLEFMGNVSPMALAVSEPQVYYNIFEKNWGLSGKRLVKKLVAESGIPRISSKFNFDSIKLVEFENGRVLAVSHETRLPIYDRLALAGKKPGRTVPKVQFVDGVELALVNLIHEYQCPLDGSLTIILHITPWTSRLIFLQGTEILHLSHLISDGLNTPDLAAKLYNRLQFELDSLNIRKIDSIIISGASIETGIAAEFERYFGERIVKSLKLHSLATNQLEYHERESLAHYAPAIGAACRLIDPRMKCLYQIDLTPPDIRDAQNRLSLSVFGWFLLIFLPILTAGLLFQIGKVNWELKQYQAQLIPKQAQLELSIETEKQIEIVNSKLVAFEKTGALLDSLKSGNQSFGAFLARTMTISSAYSNTWLTEAASDVGQKTRVAGFSLNRSAIPGFARELCADINTVEAQEIRDHPVYRFELDVDTRAISNSGEMTEMKQIN